MKTNPNIRNIAIIAHVDHGKTTLVDGLLRQSGLFRQNQQVDERVMDSIDLERERGITLVAKNTSVQFGDVRINIVDTPGHADFGGEVERALEMVDGAVLLVDSAEGPLPQTRFVLKHALARGMRIIVVVNKMDRPDERAKEVLDEIYELFMNLGASDEQFDFPVVYTDARKQIAVSSMEEKDSGTDLSLLFRTIISHLPGPKIGEASEGTSMLFANTSYSDYLGRLGIGKIHSGTIKNGNQVVLHREDGSKTQFKISALFRYEGLKPVVVESADAGEIVLLAGLEDMRIGDSVTDVEIGKPRPRIHVEEPTITIELCVNTSPLAGKEGDRLTSRVLWDRIQKELLNNVSMKAERTQTGETFIIKGRGELQFGILAEQMRREGYEFALGRPRVILKEVDGEKHEPLDRVVMDIPDESLGKISERLGTRKGEMVAMSNLGDRVRVEFNVPSRGLIGFRTDFLNITRGQGIMSAYSAGYVPWKGSMLDRTNGAIVADRAGATTAYALFNLDSRGKLFIGEGVDVYEGMIVGENNRINDLNVNVVRGKKLTNVRASGKDDAVVLTPVRPMTLDWAIAWLAEDELLEVTPTHMRLRKRILQATKRSVVRSPKEE